MRKGFTFRIPPKEANHFLIRVSPKGAEFVRKIVRVAPKEAKFVR